MTPTIGIILPVYAQGDHIQRVVEAYLLGLRSIGQQFEMLLVVNSQSDNSLDVCRNLERKHAEVRTMSSEPGWGRAVIAGIEATEASIICYTNCARTDPNDLVLAIRYALVNDRIVVKASRKLRVSLARRIGSVLYNFEARMLFGLAVWDVNGTPKVFPRSLLPTLAMTESGDLIDLEFLANCKQSNTPILEMPVYPTMRHGGKSTTRLPSAFRMYYGAIRMYLQRRKGLSATSLDPFDSSPRV